jgi:hypothetical protein
MQKRDIEDSRRALSQLGQSMAALDQLQAGLLEQTGDLTRQMVDMFDLLERRGSRAEQLVATLSEAISVMSRLTNDMASVSDTGRMFEQQELQTMRVSSSSSLASPMSPSQSQLRNFFSYAVRRGFGGM